MFKASKKNLTGWSLLYQKWNLSSNKKPVLPLHPIPIKLSNIENPIISQSNYGTTLLGHTIPQILLSFAIGYLIDISIAECVVSSRFLCGFQIHREFGVIGSISYLKIQNVYILEQLFTFIYMSAYICLLLNTLVYMSAYLCLHPIMSFAYLSIDYNIKRLFVSKFVYIFCQFLFVYYICLQSVYMCYIFIQLFT